MRAYKQLTEYDRYSLKLLLVRGTSKASIAKILNCHRSTIYREINRNSSSGQYHERFSHTESLKRKAKNAIIPLSYETHKRLKDGLEKKWSPEQICGRAQEGDYQMPSHETIYQYIYRDSASGGELYKNLRRSKKHRKRPTRRASLKEALGNRKSIEDRPSIINNKIRFGDWEGDLIVGRGQSGYLMTLVDRKSKYTLIEHSLTKTSKSICRQVVKAIKRIPKQFRHSITFDNGSEFAQHKKMEARTGCDVYFAHPYSSWERGLNENTNGLIRQYFPKKHDFSGITKEEVIFVEKALNNRPRKTLNFRTPNELFLAL